MDDYESMFEYQDEYDFDDDPNDGEIDWNYQSFVDIQFEFTAQFDAHYQIWDAAEINTNDNSWCKNDESVGGYWYDNTYPFLKITDSNGMFEIVRDAVFDQLDISVLDETKNYKITGQCRMNYSFGVVYRSDFEQIDPDIEDVEILSMDVYEL